jgi:hypothetical protein
LSVVSADCSWRAENGGKIRTTQVNTDGSNGTVVNIRGERNKPEDLIGIVAESPPELPWRAIVSSI